MSLSSIDEHASVARADAASSATTQVLAFRLGNEEYGVDILRVQEIRGFEAPTRIAGAPDAVRGVLNLRGIVVPVVDLRACFGVEARQDAQTVTIVVNLQGRTVGTVVDAVSDVVALDRSALKAAPVFGNGVDVSYITALGVLGEGEHKRTLILMDLERLMLKADLGLAN